MVCSLHLLQSAGRTVNAFQLLCLHNITPTPTLCNIYCNLYITNFENPKIVTLYYPKVLLHVCYVMLIYRF